MVLQRIKSVHVHRPQHTVHHGLRYLDFLVHSRYLIAWYYCTDKMRARGYILTILRNPQITGTAVHLLEQPIQDLCSNPGHQFKGHYVPLFNGVLVKVQAPHWVAHQQLVLGSFFVVVARQISSHLTMGIPVAYRRLQRLFICVAGE